MAAPRIQPRTLKGFRDYPPVLAIARERLLETVRGVYRSYGFVPIDTPALEYTEVLLGKGGEEADKQLFRFTDNGGRDVALRFDLTVPFARFAAQHLAQLGTPFKRYHLAPVWRGENTQRGRYREFLQCDFDTIGTTSNAADIEVALVIGDVLAALGFERFTVHVNNRMVLNGLLAELGLAAASVPAAARARQAGQGRAPRRSWPRWSSGPARPPAQARRVLAPGASSRATTSPCSTSSTRPSAPTPPRPRASPGCAELVDVVARGGPPGRALPDRPQHRPRPRLLHRHRLRGVPRRPAPGSARSAPAAATTTWPASTPSQALPGVGASLGLDRLLAAMEELGLLAATATMAPVLVTQFDAAAPGRLPALAARLRAAGIGVEVYPDARKLGPQLAYAERKGFRLAIIAGSDELAAGHLAAQGPGRRHPAARWPTPTWSTQVCAAAARRTVRPERRQSGLQTGSGSGRCVGVEVGVGGLEGQSDARAPARPPPAAGPGPCCRRPRATGSSPWRRRGGTGR